MSIIVSLIVVHDALDSRGWSKKVSIVFMMWLEVGMFALDMCLGPCTSSGAFTIVFSLVFYKALLLRSSLCLTALLIYNL